MAAARKERHHKHTQSYIVNTHISPTKSAPDVDILIQAIRKGSLFDQTQIESLFLMVLSNCFICFLCSQETTRMINRFENLQMTMFHKKN